MDQLVNQAAKIHYMSGGKLKVPLRLRTTLGATRRSAAQHSQTLHAWVSHIPGLKVALPSTPYDAKGLLKTRDPRRQPGRLLRRQDDVSRRQGAGARRRYTSRSASPTSSATGEDITIVATSTMVHVALEAADRLLQEIGVSAEVVDPRTLVPLDQQR